MEAGDALPEDDESQCDGDEWIDEVADRGVDRVAGLDREDVGRPVDDDEDSREGEAGQDPRLRRDGLERVEALEDREGEGAPGEAPYGPVDDDLDGSCG